MPGEWIKMRMELHDSPKVGKIARLTGLDRFGVVGRLHRIWGWVDQTSEDGQGVEGEHADIDELAQHPGFAAAMTQVGWLQEVAGVLTFANFTEHNGLTAKRRAEDAKRKWQDRKGMSAECPQNVQSSADKVRTDSGRNADREPEPEPEPKPEIRKKTNTPPAVADGSGSFDAWWVMYPVRGEGIPRGNKRKAWAEWVKLGDDARADVVEATRRLVKSGTYPKDAERFLKGSKGADPPYRAYLDDSPAPVVIGGSKPTAAQVKESRNHEYDASWLDEYENRSKR